MTLEPRRRSANNYSAASVGGAVSNKGTLSLADVDFLGNGAYFGAGLFAVTGIGDGQRREPSATGRSA